MEISIRPMVEEDLPTVVEIDQDSFALSWPASSFRYELTENPVAELFVAAVPGEGNEEVIGYIGLWELHKEGHISTLAVRAEHRRKGVAEALLGRALDHFSSRGIEVVTLEVRKSNSIAQKLYRKHGFEVVGERRGYYSDNAEDALLMTLHTLAEARAHHEN